MLAVVVVYGSGAGLGGGSGGGCCGDVAPKIQSCSMSK